MTVGSGSADHGGSAFGSVLAGRSLSFGALLGHEIRRTARRGGTILCSLVLAPLFAVVAGVLFETNLVMPVGGFGFLDASLVSFPAIAITLTGLVVTPLELLARRTRGGPYDHAGGARMIGLFVADLMARLVLLLGGVIVMVAIGALAFGVRPAGGWGSALAMLGAVTLGAGAFVVIGQLLAGILSSERGARVLGFTLCTALVLASGAVVPLELLPAGVRQVASFSPVTQLVVLLRETWLAGPFSALALPIGMLVALFGAAAVLLWSTTRRLGNRGTGFT